MPAGAADPPAPRPQTPPRAVDLTEQVEVHEVQLDVTLWPTDGDVARCAALTREDIDLTVDGVPTPLTALLPLASPPAPATPVAVTRTPDPRPGLSLVVLIDEYHHSCPVCEAALAPGERPLLGAPLTRDKVYASARRMIREAFHPGDRVLIATYAWWPAAETDWLTDADAAVAALDRLEAAGHWVPPDERAHEHVAFWFEGMLSFVRALGQYPGPKDLLFPTCHFPVSGSNAEELLRLVQAAQASDVTLHTVEVITRSEHLIGPLAANLGGRRFTASQGVAGAVQWIRQALPCRFLLAFKATRGHAGRAGRVVHVDARKPGFDVRAPFSIAEPGTRLDDKIVRESLFALHHLEHGYVVETSLWPILPRKGGHAWKALLFASLRRTPGGGPLEGDRREITADAVAYVKGHPGTALRRVLAKDEARAVQEAHERRTIAFAFDLAAGAVDTTVMVHDSSNALAAVDRRSWSLPRAKDAAPWWFTSRRQVRIDGAALPVPDADSTYASGEAPRIVGYACPDAPVVTGRLLRDGGGDDDVPLTLTRIEFPKGWSEGGSGCGWFGTLAPATLAAGAWTFAPGGARDGARPAGVLFRVR